MRRVRWAVVGSRGFSDKQLVEDVLAVRVGPLDTVVSGQCEDSPDAWAEHWAKSHDIAFLPFPAQWRGPDGSGPFNRGAGFARNTLIVANCDQMIAFWDGQSRGTADSIRKAEAAGKPVTVISDPALAAKM